MTQHGRSDAARVLLQQFQAALEAEAAAREALRTDPGRPELVSKWLRAIDATHEASRMLREGTRE